ncbi:MAG: ABC transporter permease [Bacteroidales bacterium]|jgi:molybdate/tungstate transport system permease protein|nr:ABC transporter permease [Bacteroidales bacterium]
MMTNRLNIFTVLLMLTGSLVLLFVIAPLLGMFIHTSGSSIVETIKDTEVTHSILLTLGSAMAATFIFSLGIIPLAWLMARHTFRGKRLIQGIIDLPVVIPHSAAGIALLGVVSENAVFGKAAAGLGFSFIGTVGGVILAMAFVSLPFLYNAARDSFESMDRRLEYAAMNLGASPARTFFTISLPLAKNGIISGMIMMFARGMSEFGAIVIIAYYPMVTPVMIYDRFASFGLEASRPIALLFICIALVVFIIIRLFTRKSYVRS